MERAKLVEILRNEYLQTAIMVVIVVVSFVTFWYGMRFVFRTEHPLYAVASESMRPTLEVGDLILVHGVQNACKIHAAPKNADPPGDIIVFNNPAYPGELIVHRAVEKIVRTDGSCYFRTQGDNNPGPDYWEVKESDIAGKYTGAKLPLFGYIALFMEPLQVKVAFLMLYIILLIILEFVPLWRKRAEGEQAQTKPL